MPGQKADGTWGTDGKAVVNWTTMPSCGLSDPDRKAGKDGSHQRNATVKAVSFEYGYAR